MSATETPSIEWDEKWARDENVVGAVLRGVVQGGVYQGRIVRCRADKATVSVALGNGMVTIASGDSPAAAIEAANDLIAKTINFDSDVYPL